MEQFASEVQVDGQVAALAPHTYGAHVGRPAPLTIEHVPFAGAPSAAEHALQAPLQAASQQKPSTQLPVAHWFPVVQTAPFVSLDTQTLPLQ